MYTQNETLSGTYNECSTMQSHHWHQIIEKGAAIISEFWSNVPHKYTSAPWEMGRKRYKQ